MSPKLCGNYIQTDGKGVAVKTSIFSLKKAIESIQQEVLVQAGRVKYLDFHSNDIKPSDCLVDGHLSPLLKRISFSHENEVRLFIVPDITPSCINEFKPTGVSIKIDVNLLIEEILISPFTTEPYISSVISICEKYGIPAEKIRKSTLLSGADELIESIFTMKNITNQSTRTL